MTSAIRVTECACRCRRPAASIWIRNRSQVRVIRAPRVMPQGNATRTHPANTLGSLTRSPRRTSRDRSASLLFFWFRRGPMLLKLHSSNRIEWPLGTGRSSMHGMRLADSPRRSTFGQKGTAQGNRGSAAQGGIRQHSGFLPFQTSGSARARAVASNPFPTLIGFERGQSGVLTTVPAPNR